MANYEKSCYTCGGIITMKKNDTGQWRPFDLDGEPHSCSANNNDLDSVNKNVSSNTSTNQGQPDHPMRCTVRGCPKMGTLTLDMGANSRWFCRHHFREDPKKWAQITADIRRHPENYQMPRHWADRVVDMMMSGKTKEEALEAIKQ